MKRFPSLKKNSEFVHIYQRKISKADRNLILFIGPSQKEENRIGISVSKKVGNSVVRHHLTRQIREIFRHHRLSLREGFDLIVQARPAAAQQGYSDLEASFLYLCKKQGVLKENADQ